MRRVVAGKQGKITLGIFAALVVVAIAAISFFVVQALALSAQSYSLEAGSIFYDKNDRYVQVQNTATIAKRWSGDWRVTEGEKTYDLGAEAVIYDSSASAVSLFGEVHRVYTDGSVELLSGKTDVEKMLDFSFYKLADRYYAMIAPEIHDEKDAISAQKYLAVRIDKAGNAWLMNDEKNIKMVEPVILTAEGNSFDVANEKLTVSSGQEGNPLVIDLTRISGSSNEYKPSTESSSSGSDKTNNNTDNSNNASDSSSSTNSSSTNSGSGSSASASGGAGGTSSSSSSSGSSSGGGSSSGSSSDGKGNNKIAPSLVLTGISSQVTSFTLRYSCYDPSGLYASVYAVVAKVTDGEARDAQQYLLSEGNNTKTMYDLDPDSLYQVTLGYTTFQTSSSESGNYKADFAKVKTGSVQSSITVPVLSAQSITCNVKLDNRYPLDSAQLVLYCDGKRVTSQDIGMVKAREDSGWTTTFANPGTANSTCVFVIEDAVYRGKTVSISATCTIRNNAVTVTS